MVQTSYTVRWGCGGRRPAGNRPPLKTLYCAVLRALAARHKGKRILMNTIFGVFDDPAMARRAVDALHASPLRLDDVSIVAPTADTDSATHSGEDVSAGQGATVGAVWVGLVGLAALLIPGVGPFIAFGALGAALTGAVTGAVVGGVTAALIDFSGIPEDEAHGYEQQIRAGKTLLAVKARDEDTSEVRRILDEIGASTVRDDQADLSATVRRPVRVAMYDDQGQRVGEQRELGATHQHGIYDTPAAGRTDRAWTSGEVVGEGQGSGPRKDTGRYDAEQWVGEGQGDRTTTDDTTKRHS